MYPSRHPSWLSLLLCWLLRDSVPKESKTEKKSRGIQYTQNLSDLLATLTPRSLHARHLLSLCSTHARTICFCSSLSPSPPPHHTTVAPSTISAVTPLSPLSLLSPKYYTSTHHFFTARTAPCSHHAHTTLAHCLHHTTLTPCTHHAMQAPGTPSLRAPSVTARPRGQH